jgi:hypothetical protein
VKGVPNFGQVSPTLFRGGLPGPDGIKGLKKMDFQVVIDLRGRADKVEEIAVERLGMDTFRFRRIVRFPAMKGGRTF